MLVESAVRFDPKLVEAHALTNLARQRGDTVAAHEQFALVQQFRQAETNRVLALGAIRAGAELAEKHDYQGAIEQFRKALGINSDLGGANFNLGGALCFRRAGATKQWRSSMPRSSTIPDMLARGKRCVEHARDQFEASSGRTDIE